MGSPPPEALHRVRFRPLTSGLSLPRSGRTCPHWAVTDHGVGSNDTGPQWGPFCVCQDATRYCFRVIAQTAWSVTV